MSSFCASNVTLTVNFKIKVSIATFNIKLPNSHDKVTLELTSDLLTLRCVDKADIVYDFARTFHLSPDTCSSLKYAGDRIVFRVHAKPKSTQTNAVIYEELDIVENTDVNVKCSNCYNSIVDSKSFTRVRALPSERCFESQSNFWCHEHGHKHDEEQPKKDEKKDKKEDKKDIKDERGQGDCGLGKEGSCSGNQTKDVQRETNSTSFKCNGVNGVNDGTADKGTHNIVNGSSQDAGNESKNQQKSKVMIHQGCCLVNEQSLVMSHDLIKGVNTSQQTSEVVVCARCLHPIGQMFKSKMKVTSESPLVEISAFNTIITNSMKSYEQDMETRFSRLLLNECENLNCQRFIVESSTNQIAENHFLVTIMNTNACNYVTSKCADVIELVPRQCMHVMYIPVKDNESILAEWEKDMYVHSVRVPSHVALHVLTAMVKRTQELLPSSRYVKPYYIGVLYL